jgi:hypothetical protein
MTFYRRNLPHWHPVGKTIFLTWRLYGSLPVSVLKKLAATSNRNDSPGTDLQESPGRQFLQFDAALDSARSGPLWLADPELADYAEYPIWRGADLGRFVLHAYVVMPNHVHILLDPCLPLAKISGVIKGVSARCQRRPGPHRKALLARRIFRPLGPELRRIRAHPLLHRMESRARWRRRAAPGLEVVQRRQ